MKKQNCWEFKKCGREPGGLKNAEYGICPTSTNLKFDKINSGKNGGRYCFVLAGTFCNEKIQCMFAQKLQSCFDCDFFMIIQTEEMASGTFNPPCNFHRY